MFEFEKDNLYVNTEALALYDLVKSHHPWNQCDAITKVVMEIHNLNWPSAVVTDFSCTNVLMVTLIATIGSEWNYTTANKVWIELLENQAEEEDSTECQQQN